MIFPPFFSIFLVFFLALLVFAAATGCLCVEGVVFVSLVVCSESFLDDDGVCNCLNKSVVTIIVVVFFFSSGFVSMPLLVVILWS